MIPNTIYNPSSIGSFFLIAGPCVVENREVMDEIAITLKELTSKLGIPFIFKASYKKANRSRLDSFSGIGDEKALEMIQEICSKHQLASITDIHSAQEAAMAAPYVDILQIPAFLCRQTDILLAAGLSGKGVNIKKGQFLAPESIKFAVEKVKSTGNNKVLVTDRGTMFGYGDLIVDMRAIPIMRRMGLPVVLDITHSLQQPNQSSGVTGGLPELIETIALSGIAAGADGIFLETHPQPEKALSDGANMLPLNRLEKLLTKMLKVRNAILE